MKLFDMIIMCLRNLWRRKGRTLLTVIGVIIGCCAIIVMISLGQGMNAAMDNMLASWGDLNAITIYGNNRGGNVVIGVESVMGGGSGSDDRPKLDEEALRHHYSGKKRKIQSQLDGNIRCGFQRS